MIIRRFFKLCFKVVGYIVSIPLLLLFLIMGYISDLLDRFSDVAIVIAYVPFYLGEILRNLFYKVMLNNVGKKVVFKFGTYCQYRNISIGDNCFFGYFTTIGEVKIGNNIICGTHVIFQSGTHQHSYEKGIGDGKREQVKIGDNIWIGNNCVIANNIGDNCVLGTSTLVIKALDNDGVYIKQPAELLKKLVNNK